MGGKMTQADRILQALQRGERLTPMDALDRFMGYVNKTDSCWNWFGPRNVFRGGYGRFNWNYKIYRAHRFSYLLYRGDIPDGMCVCHKCDNPSCVNPDHLFLGTQAENIRDAKGKNRLAVGDRNKSTKLTESEIREIRKRYIPGDPLCGQKALGDRYGVTHGNIHQIITGKTWKWVAEHSVAPAGELFATARRWE
jgi:hypothetical protein